MSKAIQEAEQRLARLRPEREKIHDLVRSRVVHQMSPGDREQDINGYLDAIAGSFSPPVYNVVNRLLHPALGVLFTPGIPHKLKHARIVVEGPLEQLRNLAASGTLVFVPTHSSNLDSVVLGAALPQAGLPPCAYAAGKHLYRNSFVGSLVSRLGAYQVDRAMNDALYKAVVKEYSTVLLERGVHSVIFAGATRCRSNRLETSLKLGLLGTVFDAEKNLFAAGRPHPIYVVPVTLNYEVVPEAEVLIQFFLEGRAAERIFGNSSLSLARLQRTVLRVLSLDETVVVRFANPVDTSRSGAHSVDRLESLITESFRNETVFMATHVVSRALYDLAPTIETGRSFTKQAVEQAVQATRLLLQGQLYSPLRGLPSSELISRALAKWQSCHDSGVVRRIGDRFEVCHGPLLLYYRNRSAHLP